jgi:hypothetical protein
MSICGSCYADPGLDHAASYYFSYFADIWGWATWRRAWQYYDCDMSRWPEFKRRGGLEALAGGRQWHAAYWSEVFDATYERRIGTWDYQWIYTVMEQNGLACYPTRNLVSNIGFRADATHTVVGDTSGESDPAANLPHQKLEFPLVHPTHVARFAPLERQVEQRRLKLDRKLLKKGSLQRKAKGVGRRLLGETALGVIDYFLHREQRMAWGGPFNGQPFRQALFSALIEQCKLRAIIETGTHRGTTAELMAKTGLPVFTIEANARCYGFAKARLWKYPQVTLRRGDSRRILEELFQGPLKSFRKQALFAYLDAHWNVDLPLAQELRIIFGCCTNAVVMVDDFEVSYDSGYGYDDYGPGKALTRAYIDPVLRAHNLHVFYPSTPSHEERGMRRGCVVLCKDAESGEMLRAIPLLRRVETEVTVLTAKLC